jgi:hypothetical protein
MHERAHAGRDGAPVPGRGLELPTFHGIDRRSIVFSAGAVVDVRVEYGAIRRHGHDHDHVEIAISGHVWRPVGAHLAADVRRNDGALGARRVHVKAGDQANEHA